MQNAAGARHTEESFEMAGVVPHHGGHAVAGLQSEFRQSRREPERAPIEIAIAGASEGLVRFAGDDLDARKNLPGTLQDGGQRQRKIHHGAAHKTFRAGSKFSASYHFSFAKGKGARGGLRKACAASGQFQLQKGSISERMQQTAEVPVSLPRRPRFFASL